MTCWPKWTSAALAAALSGLSLAAHADSSITVFDWSGYEEPAFHEAFVDKHGFSPNFAFFADEEEEAFQKLRAGFKADLAHPCSQSVPRWREAGLLEPIDPTKIPNWDKLNPELRDLPGFVYEGKPYWVPFEWGNSGLTYRTDLVPAEDVQSLQVFADPKYAGKISINDNVDDAYALASKEGLSSWVCGYVRLKGAEGSEDEAYDYLNAIADARVSPNLVENWGYGHSNLDGMAAVDPAVLAAKGYADVEKFRDKTLFQAPMPPALRQRMIAEFEQIKAGF